MQKFRYIQHSIALLALPVFFFHGTLYSQDWAKLYQSDQIAKLYEYRQNGEIKNQEWQRLVDLLFVENLEEALPGYVTLFEQTQNQEIRQIILDRLSQYYYARGLYETADKIFEDADFRNKIFDTKKIDNKYWGVQVGAFKAYQNALAEKSKLAALGEAITIIKSNSGLYKVIVGKFTSEKEVKNLQKRIRMRYNKMGLIVNYYSKGG